MTKKDIFNLKINFAQYVCKRQTVIIIDLELISQRIAVVYGVFVRISSSGRLSRQRLLHTEENCHIFIVLFSPSQIYTLKFLLR